MLSAPAARRARGRLRHLFLFLALLSRTNGASGAAKVEAALDEELLTQIARAAADEAYEVLGVKGYYLDHGTAVPLYFLLRNGWRGSLVALGYSFLSNEDHLRFGACIKGAVDALGR